MSLNPAELTSAASSPLLPPMRLATLAAPVARLADEGPTAGVLESQGALLCSCVS